MVSLISNRRSKFDPFTFVRIQENIFWRGVASGGNGEMQSDLMGSNHARLSVRIMWINSRERETLELMNPAETRGDIKQLFKEEEFGRW